MNRRSFAKAAATSLSLASSPALPPSIRPASGRMKLGTQHGSTDEILRTIAALGVTHICSSIPSRTFDEHWSVEGLTRLREHVESFGIVLAAVPLPLSSSYIAKSESPAIMLAGPDRDREIDTICKMIENCAKAGIPAVKYNLTILGVVRGEPSKGRGGAAYSTFHYATEAAKNLPPADGGPASSQQMWERITYFLKTVVPVAESNKVRMACHPHDPGMPEHESFRGVHRVLGSVAGLKRFIQIQPSPYHGLNFCQGTVSEMLEHPAAEIFDVIRYFGSRKKIFNVHFRNIHGGFLNFQETFPDSGDIDMVRALRVYQEVGYDGMLMPDHVPIIEGDTGGRQAFAFSFGYIRGLMQSAGV